MATGEKISQLSAQAPAPGDEFPYSPVGASNSKKATREQVWQSNDTVLVTGDPSTRATRASAVQDAINEAEDEGKDYVFVPWDFIKNGGYDASAVNFSGSGGTWSGRMVREGQQSDVYDVKAYGAASDGTTDDASAVQEAIDGAGNGARVVFPGNGTYRLASSISAAYSRLTIDFAQAIVEADSVGDYAFKLGDDTGHIHSKVRGGQLNLVGADTSGVLLDYVTNGQFLDCRVLGDSSSGQTALEARGGTFIGRASGLRTQKVKKGILLDVGPSSGFTPNNFKVTNNWLKAENIGLHVAANVIKVPIVHNYFEGTGTHCIHLEDGNRADVRNIYFEPSAGTWARVDANNCTVRDVDGSGGDNGIQLFGDQNTVVISDVVSNPASGFTVEVQTGATNNFVQTDQFGDLDDQGTQTLVTSMHVDGKFRVRQGVVETKDGYEVSNTQVVGSQVTDADLGNTPNTGDTATDDLITALKNVITTHGLGST